MEELGQLYSGSTPSTHVDSYWGGEIVWVTPNDLSKLKTRYIADSERRITELGLWNSSAHLLPKGSLIISSRAPIGYLAIAQSDFCTNQGCKTLVFAPEQDPEFHYYNLSFRVRSIREKGEGTTFAEISKTALAKIEFPVPDDKGVQTAIAGILATVDQAIAQTEALIAKQRRIKAGLLHDLLTRGIDAQGNLRDPATHRFKASPVGLVPEEWEVESLESIIASAIDGPFGSNLKTEHYVADNGVRVIRLQNIGTGRFEDSDKAYVSWEHAQRLSRHEVVPGDLLVAALGDDNHLIGRACLYPIGYPPAINKADCFRLRLRPALAIPEYVMHALNSTVIRAQIDVLGQGVTRNRVNLTKFKSLVLCRPSIFEQHRIHDALSQEDYIIAVLETQLRKHQALKTGLMQDLLSGRVSVAGLATSIEVENPA